ncbi:unnamed protein product, partial [marine sediment metagenome]
KDAARRMALPSLAAKGLRPLPAGAAELVLQQLLEGVPAGSYFENFKPFRNSACAVLRALETLENSLWSPHALRRAADGAFRDPAAPVRLGQLADLWDRLNRWKADRGLFSADDLLVEAGRPELEPAQRPEALFLYGFYDFTPAQRALVRRLISLAEECWAYLLWAEHDGEPSPGFEYAGPTVAWLQEVLGAAAAEPASGGAAGGEGS